MKGFLIIDRVHIKKGATIGLRASIMGDVVVGENATIKPHTVLMPKTRVKDGELYGDTSTS
jgi:UDP-3-O-[3-hydroxymyristoyl] glucosamine N-acyltransferase